MIIILLYAGYECEIVDAKGQRPTKLPQPDRNDIQQVGSGFDPIPYFLIASNLCTGEAYRRTMFS